MRPTVAPVAVDSAVQPTSFVGDSAALACCCVDPTEIARLARFLALTASPSDGEALNAARKANAIVDRAGLTYDDLFDNLAERGGTADRRELEKLRAEILRLRQQLRTSPAPASDAVALRVRLLRLAPLLTWERTTLNGFASIEPKSRREYFVLWLAGRYRECLG